MTSLTPYLAVAGTPTRALILERLHYLYRTSHLVIEGQSWTSPTLERIADALGIHKATVLRAVRWFADHGLIQIMSRRWGHSPRLYFRFLIRAKSEPPARDHKSDATWNATSRNLPSCNLQPADLNMLSKEGLKTERDAAALSGPETSTPPFPETEEPTPPPPAQPHQPIITRMVSRLRGSLETAKERMDEARAKARTGGRGSATPTEIAVLWNDHLQDFGYGRFPLDPKSLRHVKLCLAKMGVAPTIEEAVPALAERIRLWQLYRPKDLGKAAPHPWAIARAEGAWRAANDTSPLALPPDTLDGTPSPAFEAPDALECNGTDMQQPPPIPVDQSFQEAQPVIPKVKTMIEKIAEGIAKKKAKHGD